MQRMSKTLLERLIAQRIRRKETTDWLSARSLPGYDRFKQIFELREDQNIRS